MERFYQQLIAKDLHKKMVFVGGPRQVGKTTLCQAIGASESYDTYQYFNWDNDEDRKIITDKTWHRDSPLVIFDELHKFSRWKQWIKGVYDQKLDDQQYLVTGSARLDVYKKGGDSLLGRYHYWRLHPLTLDELPENISQEEGYRRLLTLGGFPEPFLGNDVREARRWRRERFTRIIKEDIRDLSMIRDIRLLELFVDALRGRAGQLVVLANLAEDLQIAPQTAKEWLQLIERMYIGFAVYPFTQNVPRSLHKPSKVYFYDNADTHDEGGSRLENLVATTLLKRLHFLEDYHGHRCQLHYIRDRDGREVDFATVIDGKLIDLIEVKSSNSKPSSALKYYAERLQPERATQIVGDLQSSFEKGGIKYYNPIDFFAATNPFVKT